MHLQQHMPNAGWRILIIPAIAVPKPVKFWESWNTNDADCLFVLVAMIITTVTTKEAILMAKAPFEILPRSLELKRLMNVARKVMS